MMIAELNKQQSASICYVSDGVSFTGQFTFAKRQLPSFAWRQHLALFWQVPYPPLTLSERPGERLGQWLVTF
ncbi:MAG: hypothetical protein R2867_18700 [Caldilineaceae bacterium]